MKKILFLSLIVSMFFGSALTVTASVYDNWKGTLQGRDRTIGSHYYGDSEGRVMMNYTKGQGNYVVNLTISGLKPLTKYDVKFLTPKNGNWDRQTVGYFTTDIYGDGSLNVRGFEPNNWSFDEEEHAFVSVYWGAWRVATTWGDATEGSGQDIEPVGSNRGK
jgi:hypothetical protein